MATHSHSHVAHRRRIDVHNHYLGGVVEALLSKGGFSVRGGFKLGRWSVGGALEFMDRQGIETQILSFALPLQGVAEDPSGPARLARQVNDEMAAIVKQYPDRFGAFAALPLNDATAAVAEMSYALDELGMDGVLLTSNAYGNYLGQPFWEPVLAQLERRQVPAFIHPTDCPCIEKLGMGRPSSVIEYPVDTARNITNAIYSGAFLRYPHLQLILAHAGGVLPTLGWRIAEHAELGRAPGDAEISAEHVRQVLRGLYYEVALAGGAHSLQPTLQVTTPDHVLFGTDFPAAPDLIVSRNTANLMAFDGLSATELAAVERGNALRLFPRFA